jgi:hypothetical protein
MISSDLRAFKNRAARSRAASKPVGRSIAQLVNPAVHVRVVRV